MTDESSRGSDQLFLAFGQERAQAVSGLQKQLLEAYEQASRAWLSRVESEIVLWSDLAARLSAVRSPSDAIETYAKCVSQRMRMAADDGQSLLKEGQELTQKIDRLLRGGQPGGADDQYSSRSRADGTIKKQ